MERFCCPCIGLISLVRVLCYWRRIPRLEAGACACDGRIFYFMLYHYHFFIICWRVCRVLRCVCMMYSFCNYYCSLSILARVGKAWRDAKVCKDYYCVVEGYLTDLMSSSSTSSTNKNNDNDKIYELEGLLRQKNNNKSRSVTVKHLPRNFNKKTYQYNKNEGRYCRLEWSLIQPAVVTVNNDNACFNNEYNLICVRTNSGARHQVRAMLAQLGNVPIAGDLRYGSSTSAALGDISVALHARTLALPSVKLGDMDLSVPFVAPIPSSWKSFFGLKEADLPKQ